MELMSALETGLFFNEKEKNKMTEVKNYYTKKNLNNKTNNTKKGTSKNKRHKNKNMRTAFIRVAMFNKANKDYPELDIKEGDVVVYEMDDILFILEEWSKTNKSLEYYVILHDEDPDNLHFHIVIRFGKTSVQFNTIKNKFFFSNIEPCSNVKNAVCYLTHQNDNTGKKKYDWSEVRTNNPNKLEMFKVPSIANLNVNLNSVLEKIERGEIKMYDLDKIDNIVYSRYKTQIERAFEKRTMKILSNPHRNVKVIFIYGKTGLGKTSFAIAYAKAHGKTIKLSGGSNDVMDSYCQEECICLDDVVPGFVPIQEMLKITDNHHNTAIISRYKNKVFVGDMIFICSNTHLFDWYPNESEDVRKALYRRIDYVFEFDSISKDHVVHYSVNKIHINNEEEQKQTSKIAVLEKIQEKECELEQYIKFDEPDEEEFLDDLDNM